MSRYKLQVQQNDASPEVWEDVKSSAGIVLTFERESDARAALTAQFPLLVKMEAFTADRKRTRVVVIHPYQDIDEQKDE